MQKGLLETTLGACHVPRLLRQLFDLRRDVHRVGNAGNEVLELRPRESLRCAQVNDFVLGIVQQFCAVETLDHTIHNVIDERVVAARGAVAVDASYDSPNSRRSRS